MARIVTITQTIINALHVVKIPSFVDNEYILNLTQAHITVGQLNELVEPHSDNPSIRSLIENVAFRFAYGLWISDGIKLCYLLDTYRHYKQWEVPLDYYVALPNESDVDTLHYENISKLVYSIRFGRYFVRIIETLLPKLPKCSNSTSDSSNSECLERYMLLYGFHDCILFAVTNLQKLLLELLLVKNKTYAQLQNWLTSDTIGMLVNDARLLLTRMEESVVHVNSILLEVPIELYEANKDLFAERLL